MFIHKEFANRKSQNGFTLVEFLVGVAFFGLLVLAVTSLEQTVRMTNRYVDFTLQKQDALVLLQRMIEDVHVSDGIQAQRSSLSLVINGKKVEWMSQSGVIRRTSGKMRQSWSLSGGFVLSDAGSNSVEIRLPEAGLSAIAIPHGGIR